MGRPLRWGHDWGFGWCLSTFTPDGIKEFVSLCVPFNPRDPNTKPIESFKNVFGDEFYICQFQFCTVLSLYLSFNMNVCACVLTSLVFLPEPGRAERAFARYDYLTVTKFLLITKTDNLIAPLGLGLELIDYSETPLILHPWITEEELQVYADKFQEPGFAGAFNFYRAMDL